MQRWLDQVLLLQHLHQVVCHLMIMKSFLSRAAFGLMVALIVLFFVLTVILLLIVILLCVHPKKTQKGTDADLRKEPAETKAETEAEVSIPT